MTTDAKVQIGLSTDYLEGTAVDTPAGVNLFREGVVLSDPEVAAARAKIVNTTPAADDYALAVRIIGGAAGGGLTDQQLRATPVAVDTEADTKTLGTQLAATDKGLVTNTIMHGWTTAHGGSYVDIKANPSGALTVDATGSSVSIDNFPASQTVNGTVNAIVQGVPFVQANDLDIRNLSSNVDSVTVTGNVEIANDAGNPIPVTGTVFIQNVNDIQFSGAVTAYTALVPVGYDAIELSYTGDNLTGVVYKQMGTTMATLTLGYTGDKLTSVART